MSDTLIHISQPELMPSGANFLSIKEVPNYPSETLDSILLHDLLDYCVEEEIPKLLSDIVSKLTVGGSLSIQSVDIKQLCASVAFDEIDLAVIKKLLYPNRKSIHTMYDMISYIKNCGLKIVIKKYVNSIEYFIIATKL